MKNLSKKIHLTLGSAVGITAISAFMPWQALAFTCTYGQFAGPGSIEYLLCKVIQIINNYIIPLLILLGVVWFIWGIIQFITAKDEETKGEARSTMIHGVIALFVIVAVWGLVQLVRNFFGLNSNGGVDTSQFPVIY